MSQEKREEIQQEALDAVLPYRRAGLHISMGVGKTYIGLQYINKFFDKFDNKVLIVAPKVTIFESWKNDAEKFNLQHLLNRIEFVTYISLTKKNPEDYSIVILDEAHTTKYSHDEFLSQFKGRILGLTGTPPRYTYSEKGEMMDQYYPIQYRYTVNEAVDEEILNDYKIFVHRISLDNNNNIPVTSGSKTFYTSESKNYDWLMRQIEEAVNEKQIFMKRIFMLNAMKKFASKMRFAKFISKTVPQNEKCLLFANTTDQADELCEVSHHSKNDKKTNTRNLEMFSSGQATRLSAVEQLSEGITVPNLKHIVIMHSYGNEKKASQKIGRALRLNKDERSTVHVLCYEDTVDEQWVAKALADFDLTKIKWIDWKLVNNEYVKL
jgi:superfamily II DNA or RNA helicase